MSRTILITAAIAAFANVGCFVLPERPGLGGTYSSEPGAYGRGSGSLVVTSGSQRGDMGDIRRFDSVAHELNGSYSPSHSYIRLDSMGRGWWVMSAINISGDLAGPEFAPGTSRRFTSRVWNSGEPSVSVVGCSGPEYGNYTFDAAGEEVEISVQSLPNGMRRMAYTVRFLDGLVTHGSFDYQIPGSSSSGTVRAGI